MFAKVDKISFARHLASVIDKALKSDSPHGTLQFPVIAPINAKWVAEEGINPDAIFTVFSFSWAFNPKTCYTQYAVTCPGGKQAKGTFSVETQAKEPHEIFVAHLVFDVIYSLDKKGMFLQGHLPYMEMASKIEHEISKVLLGGTVPPKIKIKGTKTGSLPAKKSWGDSGTKLHKIIPGLSFKIPADEMCPAYYAVGCHISPAANRWDLSNLIIHLNDTHKWPRSAEDKPPYEGYKGANIADWVEEYAIRHKLNMNFCTEEEAREAKKEAKKEALKKQLTEPVPPFKEKELFKALKAYGLEYKAAELLTPEDLVGKAFNKLADDLMKYKWKEDEAVPPDTAFIYTEEAFPSLKQQAKEWMSKHDQLFKGKQHPGISSGDLTGDNPC